MWNKNVLGGKFSNRDLIFYYRPESTFDSEYTRAINMPGSKYARVTKGSEKAWITPECAWLCLNILEYAWLCQNLYKRLCFTFLHCYPLSTRTSVYLFQLLHETIVYSLREHKTVFLFPVNWKYLICFFLKTRYFCK